MATIKLKEIKVESMQEKPMVEVESEGDFMHCPYLYVNDRQIPEIKKFEVGESYEMIIRVTPRSKDEHESTSDERSSVELAVTAYKVIEKKSMDDMSDEEFGEYQGEALKSGKLS